MTGQIVVRGARLHNLKNITLAIPKNQLVVLSGVSGSGKSTLGFDILLKEGQRQYMEALGMLPFGMARPPVDAISGLSPTISVDQHLTNHSPRSTVGTATDVYTYLRVLYARLGRRPCPACGKDVPPLAGLSGADREVELLADDEAPAAEEVFPCPHCGAPVPALSMARFSFNKPEGACPTCTGLGSLHQANLRRLVDEKKSIAGGAVAGWNAVLIDYHSACLQAAAAYYGFTFDPSLPVRDCTPAQRDLLYYGVESPQFRRRFPKVDLPPTVRRGSFEGVATAALRRYAGHIEDGGYSERAGEFVETQSCPDCAGTRLRPESRAGAGRPGSRIIYRGIFKGNPITCLSSPRCSRRCARRLCAGFSRLLQYPRTTPRRRSALHLPCPYSPSSSAPAAARALLPVRTGSALPRAG